MTAATVLDHPEAAGPGVIVAQWTGHQARALRLALRMTNEGFADRLGVAARTVSYWTAKPEIVPQCVIQEALDMLLDRAPPAALARFTALAGRPPRSTRTRGGAP